MNDIDTPYRDPDLLAVPVKAGTLIRAGAMVVAVSGFAAPAGGTGNPYFLGRAEERVDNTDGADGERRVIVRRGKVFRWKNNGSIQPIHRFKWAMSTADDTVGLAGSVSGNLIGQILDVDADGVWVEPVTHNY
ncbi:hypothetical protein D9M71_49590 [compost metagenome]